MAVEGLDGVMIGPGDLAQSYGGVPPLDPSVMDEVVDRVSSAAAAEGKWWGIPVPSPEVAQKFHEKGARFFVCGAAIILLKNEYSRIWQEFSGLFRS
jgi:4-hydroxy-2-oxoheptanedioate aldolase